MSDEVHAPYRYSFDDSRRLDPDPLYAPLRRDEPVAWVQVPYGRECWLATRYDAVRLVLADTRFSRAAAVGPDAPRSTPMEPQPGGLVSMDLPEHTHLRQLMAPAFTKHRIERLRPRAQQLVDGLVDDMLAGGAPADLVERLAFPLPIAMICEILGVPYADRAVFDEWSRAILARAGYPVEEMLRALAEMRRYLAELIARRRAQPTDDVLGTLAQAREDGQPLSDVKVLSMATTLLVTGHESTASQLANFTYLLLTHPDQLAWLRADPARVPGAVEELLRFVPLTAGSPGFDGHGRVATVDVELDGVTVHAGDAVLPAINSANRDDRVFSDPDTLDLSRGSNPHVTFGHGMHHCLGAHLARMELQVALSTLLARCPRLALGVAPEEVPWASGSLLRRPARLPITW